MEPIVLILKYTFVVALGIEALVIVAALVRLAREKAHAAPAAAPANEE